MNPLSPNLVGRFKQLEINVFDFHPKSHTSALDRTPEMTRTPVTMVTAGGLSS